MGCKEKSTLRLILHVVISTCLLAITMLNNLLYDKKKIISDYLRHEVSIRVAWNFAGAVGACPGFLPLAFRTSSHHKMACNLLWVEFSLGCNSKALRFN